MRSEVFLYLVICECLNTVRPKQNDCHVADDISKRIFLNENCRIFIGISLIYVPPVLA